VKKFASYFLALDRKFKITQNDINKTFDQVKRSSEIRSREKKSFDQTPNLTENFDQLKMSSEIRSSDHSLVRGGNNIEFQLEIRMGTCKKIDV
jgi:hypothetical protein